MKTVLFKCKKYICLMVLLIILLYGNHIAAYTLTPDYQDYAGYLPNFLINYDIERYIPYSYIGSIFPSFPSSIIDASIWQRLHDFAPDIFGISPWWGLPNFALGPVGGGISQIILPSFTPTFIETNLVPPYLSPALSPVQGGFNYNPSFSPQIGLGYGPIPTDLVIGWEGSISGGWRTNECVEGEERIVDNKFQVCKSFDAWGKKNIYWDTLFECPKGTFVLIEDKDCVWDWIGGDHPSKWGPGHYDMYLDCSWECAEDGKMFHCPLDPPIESPWVKNNTSGPMLTTAGYDYYPKVGWRLVYKEFGTKENCLRDKYPWFVLYNKYSGLLRIFFYQPKAKEGETNSNIIATIERTDDTTQETTLLNLGGDVAFATDYLGKEPDPRDYIMLATTEFSNMEAHWAYGDFLTSYDPSTSQKISPFIEIEIDSVTISFAELLGKMDLTVNVPTHTASDFDSALMVFDKVKESYTDFDTFAEKTKKRLKKIKEMPYDEHSFFDTLIQDVFENPLGEFFLEYAGVFGIASGLLGALFSGGGEKPGIISLTGGFTLSGPITTERHGLYRAFRVPGTISNPDLLVSKEHQEPLYDKPLGTFTLIETPVIISRAYQSSGGGLWFGHAKVANNLKYSINPHSGLRLRELYAAIVFQAEEEDLQKIFYGVKFPNTWYHLENVENEENGESAIPAKDEEGRNIYTYRTRYVPYDMFKGSPIHHVWWQPFGTYKHDIDIKGVRVIAVMERTDIDVTDETPPLLFSHIYKAYVNTNRDYNSWEDNFSAETVGTVVNNFCQEYCCPCNYVAYDYREGFAEEWENRYDLPAPPRIGNLTIVHEKVTKDTLPDIFLMDEKVIIRFIQYREVEEVKAIVEKYNTEMKRWDYYTDLSLKSVPHSKYLSNNNDDFLKMIHELFGNDPERTYFHKSNFSSQIPGRYRVKISYQITIPLQSSTISLTVTPLAQEFHIYPFLNIDPSMLIFSSVYYSQSKVMEIDMYNNTSDILEIISYKIIGEGASDFELSGDQPPDQISPNSQISLGIKFEPTQIGERYAELEILVNPKNAERTIVYSVPLWGIGLYALQFSPTELDFGDVYVSTNKMKNVSVKNYGITRRIIESFSITGEDAAHFSASLFYDPLNMIIEESPVYMFQYPGQYIREKGDFDYIPGIGPSNIGPSVTIPTQPIITIGENESIQISVFCHPRLISIKEVEITATLNIFTNDPHSPKIEVPLTADIQPFINPWEPIDP